jgi:polyisoprenoid-binding protein YceI
MFRFRHSSVVSAFGVLAVALVASAGTLAVPQGQRIGFVATGPAGFKINGSVGGLKAEDDGTNLKLIVKLETATTGNDTRDEHCRSELFKIPKGVSKTASLTVAKSALKFPTGAPTSGQFSGQLSMNNKTKTVTVPYTAARKDGLIHVTGNFAFNLTDFKLDPPKKYGVEVRDSVKVAADFNIKE